MLKYLNPSKYIAASQRIFYQRRYDIATFQAERHAQFGAMQLDLDAAHLRLDDALTAIGSDPFDDVNGTDSVHWLLFSALSLSARSASIGRILEIGTFRGKTSALLRNLFPHADVVTCDLPDSDPILSSSYGRQTEAALLEYKSKRNSRIEDPGISFVEANSFFLPELAPGPFDLIWVDGGHRYPEVAWDICNAYHACRPGGIIMCDDVLTDVRGANSYAGIESHNVLNYISERANVKPLYFLKRLNSVWSADPTKRKYVALIQKGDTSPR